MYAAENVPDHFFFFCKFYARLISRDWNLEAQSQQRTLTQCDMLPQHPVNIKKLISECFEKCDFSKEQCSSLKMILGSKHVGAILNVLMKINQ